MLRSLRCNAQHYFNGVEMNPLTPAYSILVTIWAIMFMSRCAHNEPFTLAVLVHVRSRCCSWGARQMELQYLWATDDFESKEAPRKRETTRTRIAFDACRLRNNRRNHYFIGGGAALPCRILDGFAQPRDIEQILWNGGSCGAKHSEGQAGENELALYNFVLHNFRCDGGAVDRRN